MEKEQAREYHGLRDDIVVKLRHHALVDDRVGWHVFQYLTLPSFTPPVAWDVFRLQRGPREGEFVLMRSAWRSDLDGEKLRTHVERLRHPYPLVPTLEVHRLNAASGDLAHLAAELAALTLPIGAARPGIGLDGVTYEVAIEQPHDIAHAARCRLSWWHEPPLEWEGLAAWVQRAEVVFETAWAARGGSAPTPLRVRTIESLAP